MESPKEPAATSAKKAGFLTWGNLRDVAALFLMATICYRLAVSQTNINLSGFSFTDLLSLVLAIFAIGLSAAFYFKADESSRGFYDNTYSFTKHISETLGRIEERFGERLKNIDEGYVGLARKFESMPFDLKAAKEGQERQQQAVWERQAEFERLLEDVMQKANFDEGEKQKLKETIATITNELELAKAEVARYKSTIETAESFFGMSDSLFEWMSSLVKATFDNSYISAPPEVIAQKFNLSFFSAATPAIIRELLEAGVIEPKLTITHEGVKKLRGFILAFWL